MPVVRLTAKERILIHLGDFAKYADVVEVPPEMGQEGIAKAADIYVQHVRQFIDPLLQEGLVRERVAHVKGHRRRLKVYDLTDTGRLAASRLREQVRAEAVRVRDAAGVRTTTVGEALTATKGKLPLGGFVRAAIAGETVDLVAPETTAPSGFIERLLEVPRVEAFVGRRLELDALTAPGPGPRFFVVRGMAGIGKSSLAAKVCERLRGTKNLFWHRVRPWDTRETILADLGGFLAQFGRPGLKAVLARGEADQADQALREDLADTASFLVFDDAHEGIPEVHAFLRFLKDMLVAAPEVRILVLTRIALPVYDRRDVAVQGQVREIDLEGLDSKEIGELFSSDPDAPRLLPLAATLGGHPLFLELLRSAGAGGVRKGALRDVRRFIEEEIYARLPTAERKMMKVASLYEVPVPREALFLDETLSHDVLMSLVNRALLQPMGDEAFGAHDTIRDFFASVLTPSELQGLRKFAVGQLRQLAAHEDEAGNVVACVDSLSNALRLSVDESERAVLWEALGDANERIGDLPGSLTAFKSAMRGLPEAEDQARLHRKLATAFQNRGETSLALAEIELGLAALDGRPSVEQAWLDLVRCRVATKLEDDAEAMEHGGRALETFSTLHERSGMTQALLELGRIEIDRDGGRPEKALEYLEQALSQAPGGAGDAFAARAHMEMARNLAWRLLDVEKALEHIESAEWLLERSPDPHLDRFLLLLKGRVDLDLLADFAAAQKHFAEAIDLARRVHSRETIAFAQFRLAHIPFFEGRAEEARTVFETLAVEMEGLGYPNLAFDCTWMALQSQLWLGDRSGVVGTIARLRNPKFERAFESRPQHVQILGGLERWLDGETPESIAAFREAVKSAEATFAAEVTSPVYLPEMYLSAGLAALGEKAEARDHLSKCEAFLADHSLKAWLSIAPEATQRFSEFLRRAATSRGPLPQN